VFLTARDFLPVVQVLDIIRAESYIGIYEIIVDYIVDVDYIE